MQGLVWCTQCSKRLDAGKSRTPLGLVERALGTRPFRLVRETGTAHRHAGTASGSGADGESLTAWIGTLAGRHERRGDLDCFAGIITAREPVNHRYFGRVEAGRFLHCPFHPAQARSPGGGSPSVRAIVVVALAGDPSARSQ